MEEERPPSSSRDFKYPVPDQKNGLTRNKKSLKTLRDRRVLLPKERAAFLPSLRPMLQRPWDTVSVGTGHGDESLVIAESVVRVDSGGIILRRVDVSQRWRRFRAEQVEG